MHFEPVGRHPVIAWGNTNGNIPMLRFANNSFRPSLRQLVHLNDDRPRMHCNAPPNTTCR